MTITRSPKLLALSLLFLNFSILLGQGVNYDFFDKEYAVYTPGNGAGLNQFLPYSVRQVYTSSGTKTNAYTVGGIVRRTNNDLEFYAARFDDTHALVWSNRYGTNRNQTGEFIEVAPFPGGSFALCGESFVAGAVNANLGAIFAANADGSLKWSRIFANKNAAGKASGLKGVCLSGKYLYSAGFDAQWSTKEQVAVIKLDTNGNEQFFRLFDFGETVQRAYSIGESGGTVIVVGQCGANNNNLKPFLLLLNTDGSVKAAFKGNNNGLNTYNNLLINGNTVWISGRTNSRGNNDVLVAQFNLSSQTLAWTVGLGTNRNDYPQGMVYDGSLWLGAQTDNTLPRTRQGLLELNPANGALKDGSILYFGNTQNFDAGRYSNCFDNRPSGGINAVGRPSNFQTSFARMSVSPATNSCGMNDYNWTSFALSRPLVSYSVKDSTISGDFTSDLGLSVTAVSLNENVQCNQACPLPIQVLKDTVYMCKEIGSLAVDGTQPLTATYSWENGTGTATRTFFAEGTYYLTTSNPCGSRKDTVVVVQDQAPSHPGFRDTLFCTPTWSYSVDLPIANRKYIWNNGSTQAYRVFNSQPGRYWMESINACGRRVDTLTLIQGQEPIDLNLGDTFLCAGQGGSITKTINPEPFVSYLWDNGTSGLSRFVVNPGVFWVESSNICGTRRDSFSVSLETLPAPLTKTDTTFCDGFVGTYTLDVRRPGCTYFWADGFDDSIRTFNTRGTFYLYCENACGTTIDTVVISQDTLPLHMLDKEVWFCKGQPYTLKATQPFGGPFDYVWSNGARTPELLVAYTQTLILTTSNVCGYIRDTVIVHSEICPCHYYMPNAFTPHNLDGLNDGIKPQTDCPIKSGTWSIYSRWGECLAKDMPLTQAWDGMYMGEPLPEGVYIYKIYGLYDETVEASRIISDAGVIHLLYGKEQ
jgi:gliding motility-associated-like protein